MESFLFDSKALSDFHISFFHAVPGLVFWMKCFSRFCLRVCVERVCVERLKPHPLSALSCSHTHRHAHTHTHARFVLVWMLSTHMHTHMRSVCTHEHTLMFTSSACVFVHCISWLLLFLLTTHLTQTCISMRMSSKLLKVMALSHTHMLAHTNMK